MNDWKEVTLGEVCRIKYGKDHKKLNDGAIPVYGSGGIMRFVDTSIHDQKSVLIPRKGTLSNLFLVNPPFWTVDTLFWTDIETTKINTNFLYFYLKTKDLANLNVGTAVPSLTTAILNEVKIPLPPLETQQQIAKILSSLDDKIELNNKINQNLEEQAQAIFKDMILSNHNNENIELNKVANIIMGQSPKGDTYNENQQGTVFYQGRAEFGDRFPTRRLFTTDPKRISKENSILMSVRAPVGDINIAIEECCIGRGLSSIESKFGYSSFILYTMKSLKKELDLFNGEGTVFGSINKDSLSNFKIHLPTNEIIEKFEKIVNPIDDAIKNNFIQIQTLKQLRDTLLPRLMSGDIDVSNVVV